MLTSEIRPVHAPWQAIASEALLCHTQHNILRRRVEHAKLVCTVSGGSQCAVWQHTRFVKPSRSSPHSYDSTAFLNNYPCGVFPLYPFCFAIVALTPPFVNLRAWRAPLCALTVVFSRGSTLFRADFDSRRPQARKPAARSFCFEKQPNNTRAVSKLVHVPGAYLVGYAETIWLCYDFIVWAKQYCAD